MTTLSTSAPGAAPNTPRKQWWSHPALVAAMALVGILAGGVTLMMATQYFPDIDG